MYSGQRLKRLNAGTAQTAALARHPQDSKPELQGPMSDSKHNKPTPGQPGGSKTGEAKPSGRVAFDSRGNPTWEWQTSTGMFGRDVSTQRLKKLEAKELSLMDTQSVVPRPKALSLQEPGKMPGGGVNPYDSGSKSAHHHKPEPKRQSLQSKVHQAQAAPNKNEPPKQGAWTALKKNLFGKGGY
jgi:hypothetical protein